MPYFVPVLRLSAELPPQSAPHDKLGGLPWGLPASLWPTCTDCGKSQSLLAQFVHDAARLDLGRAGRVLSVFQCNHDPGMCSTWEGGSGANACFVTEPEDMVHGLSPLPPDSPPIEREARIVEWRERDDVPAADGEPDVTTSTRLGGEPFWIQGPDEAPEGGWRFVGQLDSTYSFLVAPAAGAEGISADPEQWEGRSHYCEGPNFGDGGIAYLFLRDGSTTPRGWFFWQCG